jgi:hypothetical protein
MIILIAVSRAGCGARLVGTAGAVCAIGGLGEALGSILGGGSGGGAGNNPVGRILSNVRPDNAIGEILGGLLGGKK